MSRKKKIPKLIMLYDLSESEAKVIPFRVADYTERRKKKKNSIPKEEESNNIEANLDLPPKPPDLNDHAPDLLHDLLLDQADMNDFNFIDFEKGLPPNDSQSSDCLFYDEDCEFYFC